MYKSFFDTIAIKSTNLKISNIKKKSLGKQINFRFYSKEIVSLSIDETTSLDDLYEILSCFIGTKNFDFNSIDNQLGESLPAIPKSLMRKTSYLDNKVFFIRTSPTARALEGPEMVQYISDRFKI